MRSHHRIQKVRFDIRYSSKAMMLAGQSTIGATIKENLMHTLDAILSASAIADSHIRIERLQIDLGRIRHADIKNEMEKRLQEKLGFALQQKIASLKTRPAAGEGIISRPMKLLGELEHFLLTGTLPWAAETDQRDLAQRLQIILKEAGSGFHNFLKRNRDRPQVLQRFVRQFPETALKQVLYQLAPDRAPQIIKVAEDLLSASRETSPGGKKDPRLTPLIWEDILDYVLENRNGSPTADHFLRWAASRSGRARGDVWKRFAETAAAVAAGFRPANEYPADAAQETGTGLIEAGAATRRIIRGYDLYTALQRFLDPGIMKRDSGQALKKGTVWEILTEVRSVHPEQFMRLAQDMARHPFLCERICTTLSDRQAAMLIDTMLEVIAPVTDQDAPSFLEAVKALAGQSANRKRFYADILHRIAGGRAVDLEQIAQSHAAEAPIGRKQAVMKAHKRPKGAKASAEQPAPWGSRDLAPEEISAVFDHIEGSPLPPSLPIEIAKAALEQMVIRKSVKLLRFVGDHLYERDLTLRWVRLLSDRELTRVLAHLKPTLHSSIQGAVDVVVNAGYSETFFERPEELHRLKWEFIFTDAGVVGKIPYRQGDFISRFIVFLADKTRKGDSVAFCEFMIWKLSSINQGAHGPAHQAVLYELKRMSAQTPDAGTPGASKRQTQRPVAPSQPIEMLRIKHPGRFKEETDIIESAIVQNAGLVIAAPYLPQLWKTLCLTQASKFIDRQAAERAVHLLQFMADESTQTPEYELVLNKILCGIEINAPICGGIDITDSERETIEGLIKGIIENWKTIGSISLAGFRESFLQRRGRLILKENGWHLKVTQRAFDMLLDRIPWRFSTIKHAWMETVLFVSWR